MKVVAWIPIKLNNQRLPGKNLKKLGGKPLCNYMIDTLCKIQRIDEIYVYCSDESIIPFLPESVKFLKRDKKLDGEMVGHYEIVSAFLDEITADIYINAHVTNPFVKKESIERGLEQVLNGKHDSAHTVQRLNRPLWYRNEPFNFTRTKMFRNQDIEPIFVDMNLCIYKREVFTQMHSRYGMNPYFIEIDQIESIDIDYPEDFMLAETMYQTFLREKMDENEQYKSS